jgi:flagellar hook-basal body complex protein FliE
MSDQTDSQDSSNTLEKTEPRKTLRDPISDFKKALSESIDEVNRLEQEARQKAEGMVQGKVEIHEAMIAMEQANLSLRLLIQIRNKMIAAYEEIMRMQL